MTQLTHCDGPGCEETRPEGAAAVTTYSGRVVRGGWLVVASTASDHVRHFHNRTCLARWAAPTTAPTQGEPA